MGQKIVLLKKINEGYLLKKIINVSSFNIFARINRKTFAINSHDNCFRKGKDVFYFFDDDNKTQISFVKHESPISSEEIDILMEQDVLKQLAKAMKSTQDESWKSKLAIFAFGAITGAFIIYVYLTAIGSNEVLI